MIVKQINTNMVTNTDDIQCGGTGGRDCKEVYDISDDYKLIVSEVGNYYKIELSASENGKFKNLNLIKYGDAKNATSNATSCDKSKIDKNTVSSCSEDTITGTVAK